MLVHAPEFWGRGGLIPTVLRPLGAVYGAAGAVRQALIRPTHVEVPVICIGNLVAGGAGKTPITADLAARLVKQGRRPHILTRGYGGSLAGPVAVDPARHDAATVGDEALLLARVARSWVARDRVAGARRAIADGADILLLDDGFQNPALAKDLSFLIVDGGYGFGNGLVQPAGPLRETIDGGLSRAQAVVILGADTMGCEDAVAGRRPVLRARLAPRNAGDLVGRDVLAFAGIGRPGKFYATLAELGAQIVGMQDFADHHPYRDDEIRALLAAAKAKGAAAVTTEKDWVRLPPALRAEVRAVEVAVEWREPEALDALVHRHVPGMGRRG